MDHTLRALIKLRRVALRLALALALLPAAMASADLLVTEQGESLSGELSRILDGVLVFRTSMRGQMMLPVTEVKSLSTDAPWAITDHQGAVHIGRFVTGGVEVTAGGAAPSRVTLAMADVVAAKRIPTGIDTGVETRTASPAWEAVGGTGVRAFTGSDEGIAPHVNLEIRGADARGDANLEIGFDVDPADEFPTYFRGRFEVAGVTDRPWEPFVQALAERDSNRALRLRTGLTIGVRYNFEQKDTQEWAGLAGFGGTLDRWGRAEIGGVPWPGGELDRTDTDLNLHLELRYSRALWGRGSWDSRFYVLPGLTDVSHLRAGAESSLIYPVTSRLQLRLDMLMGYEQDPVYESLERVDTSLGASIQLNF